ncbi:DnaB-like helicase C-terminal domain-containing protein [Janibacter indicus]|uniref:DnaB-like helicase C terminal domain-containing protein n=1 Tax=Janibacter indicus TaxID=857417 RepID=A0A1W2A8G1_9MICO|nr:DnaB-like helicase C-terminal domain-containing protein [Janibacter indicus]SMC56947.1 DnaB-like helicase C terminal domain-containing protein [Janibacter indicus]
MHLTGEAIGHVIAHLLGEPDATVDRDRTIPTLLIELDDFLAGGLRTGQTTVIASRPGEGSSTFALGLARAAALHQGISTLLIAPDAPESEVVMRLISAETHIPLQRLRSRTLDEGELRRLRERRRRLESAPVSNFAGSPPAGILLDTVGAMTFEEDLRLVIVDGLTTLGASTRESVARMCARAREDHHALVLVGGVLPRWSGAGTAPGLDDLREHDSLADIVDTVLVLEPHEPPAVAVHVVKHRYGPTGTVRVAHSAHTSLPSV